MTSPEPNGEFDTLTREEIDLMYAAALELSRVIGAEPPKPTESCPTCGRTSYGWCAC